MKPCSRNRKLITWLALGAREAEKAAALRDHLVHCEGCRRYWEEMSNVTASLAAAEPDANIQATEVFHRSVAEKLRIVESSSFIENLAAWLRGSMLNWRVALPVIAVLVIAAVALIAPRKNPTVSAPAPSAAQVVATYSSGSDLAPTIANYEMVANQSFEKFDELLTKQGNRRLPPAPVYTASSLNLENAAF
jgi:hypothetical protein